jgi:hypothetical protein
MGVTVRRVNCGVVIAAASMLTACAGLTVQPVTSDAREKEAKGFRYYENATFLFIHTDGKGGLTSEIVMLPDTTREMSIQAYSYWASNNTTLTFTNGTLTESNSQVDTTAVASAGLDALAKYLGAAVVAADLPKPEAPPPYLYKIYIKDGVVTLTGGSPKASSDVGAEEFHIVLPSSTTAKSAN